MFANNRLTHRVLWVSLALIVAKLIYLYIEIDYHQSLLAFLTETRPDREQANALEFRGHWIAAIGGTLMLLSALYASAHGWVFKRFNDTQPAHIFLANLMLLTVFVATSMAFVYTLQTKTMDYLLASADDQDRYNAYYLTMARTLMVDGKLDHQGLLSGSPEQWGVTDTILLANLPLVQAHPDPQFIDTWKTQSAPSLAAYLRAQTFQQRFDSDWAKYQELHEQLAEKWVAYKQQQDRMNQSLANPREQALLLINEVMTVLRSEYATYQAAVEQYNKDYTKLRRSKNKNGFSATARKIAPLLSAHYRQSNSQTQWAGDIGNQIHEAIHQMKGQYRLSLPPKKSYWCDAGQCPGGHAFLTKKLSKVMKAGFIKKHNGIPPGLSLRQFYENKGVKAMVVDMLESNLVYVKKGFDYRMVELERAVALSAKLNMIQGVNKAIGLDGEGNLRLSVDDLVQSPKVSKVMDELIGEPLRPDELMLSKADFFDRSWSVRANQQIESELSQWMPDDPTMFAEGDWYERGTDSVKSLYVVPFALFFSALFGLLNAVSVIVMIVVLVASVVGKDGKRIRTPLLAVLFVMVALLPIPWADDRPLTKELIDVLSAEYPFSYFGVRWLNQASWLMNQIPLAELGNDTTSHH